MTKEKIRIPKRPDRLLDYFKLETVPLALVCVSGIVYNVGMTAGPYFEGQLVQRLLDIMQGRKTFGDMVSLVLLYLCVISLVQVTRCVKRFYVRRFANDTGRSMRHVLYNHLVHHSRRELMQESIGDMMTKAVADVDACAEGMRKFTTEVFDTGVVMIAYLTMLFIYDWKLTLVSCLFVPIAYVIAERLKKQITERNQAYKKSAGKLNTATMDRVSHAILYRIFGREADRDAAYEERLADYEKKAVGAKVWENAMQPVYNIISMCGVLFILYFGARNVLGMGWKAWDIAAFTTFLSCFTKLALKSSKAAKLFNAVQKARVSWKRIHPWLQPYREDGEAEQLPLAEDWCLEVKEYQYLPGESDALTGVNKTLSFQAKPGEIIGVTGPVAGGKSTFGRAFLQEVPYLGQIRIGGYELAALTEAERCQLVSYMGHEPELMSDSICENISLGESMSIDQFLQMVSLKDEVDTMEKGAKTNVGEEGVCLSGGQRARLALARTLYHSGRVLVLDDPFSAVDKATETEILAGIRQFAADRIVILISHRLYHFPEFHKVIWVDKEQLTMSTHEELVKSNIAYAELYHKQVNGGDLDEA